MWNYCHFIGKEDWNWMKLLSEVGLCYCPHIPIHPSFSAIWNQCLTLQMKICKDMQNLFSIHSFSLDVTCALVESIESCCRTSNMGEYYKNSCKTCWNTRRVYIFDSKVLWKEEFGYKKMAKHRWLGNTFINKSKTGKKYHKNIQRSWIRKRPTKKCDTNQKI